MLNSELHAACCSGNFCQQTLNSYRIQGAGESESVDPTAHVHVSLHITHHFPVFVLLMKLTGPNPCLSVLNTWHNLHPLLSPPPNLILPAPVPLTTSCTAVLIPLTPNKSISWLNGLFIRPALLYSTSHHCLRWDLSSVRLMGGECDGIRMDESTWSHVVHILMPHEATRSCNKNVPCPVFPGRIR